jgi:hypothetical protein
MSKSISTFVVMLLCATTWAPSAYGACAQWAPVTNLSNDVGHFAVDPSLVIDDDGYAHVIYQSFLDSYGENFYVTNRSGSWSAPQSFGQMGGKGSAPKIVMTPDNYLHVFYGKNNLYWRTKPVAGGSWSGAVSIASNPNTGFIQGATVDSSGGIYFMYGHLFDNSAPARNGIYGRYKPLGGSWQATELVFGNNNDGAWPLGIDIAANGTTLWMSMSVGSGTYYKKKPATGTWPAGAGTFFGSYGFGAGPRFAFDPTSNEIAAFYQDALPCSDPCENDPWFETYVRFSYDDGASWSSAFNISAMVDGIDRTATGTYDSLGNLHTVWEGFCCDNKVRMRYRGRINGVWDPSITWVTSDRGGYIPKTLVADGTDLHLVFADADTGVGNYDAVYTMASPSQPLIAASVGSFSRTIGVGGSLTTDSFTINNSCVGTLNYSISDNASWLSVSPASGSVTTGSDSITVSYPGVSGLTGGQTYNATITITGNATNSPVTIPVSVTVQTVSPDQDGDGDVDMVDYGPLQACMSGDGIPQTDPDCDKSKLDGDSDVDGDDFQIYLNCFSGSNVPASTGCATLYP